MSSTVFAVSFDAHDAQAVASFWAAVLGRTVADGANGDNAAINADPAVPGSRISFHRVPEGKTVKNRMHFDLITTDFDAEVDRLIGLGATKLNEINSVARSLGPPRRPRGQRIRRQRRVGGSSAHVTGSEPPQAACPAQPGFRGCALINASTDSPWANRAST